MELGLGLGYPCKYSNNVCMCIMYDKTIHQIILITLSLKMLNYIIFILHCFVLVYVCSPIRLINTSVYVPWTTSITLKNCWP